jgi:hypothetical protein
MLQKHFAFGSNPWLFMVNPYLDDGFGGKLMKVDFKGFSALRPAHYLKETEALLS